MKKFLYCLFSTILINSVYASKEPERCNVACTHQVHINYASTNDEDTKRQRLSYGLTRSYIYHTNSMPYKMSHKKQKNLELLYKEYQNNMDEDSN